MQDFAFESFQKVTLADRKVLEELLLESEPDTCESNFLNILVWQRVYDTQFQIAGGRPWIYLEEEDELLFPWGKNGDYPSPQELSAVSKEMRKHGKSGIIHQVSPSYPERFPEYQRFFTAEPVPESIGEYVYEIDRLVQLHGSKLGKKKNLISQFTRLYPDWRALPMTAERIPDCIALSRAWDEYKLSQEDSQGIREEVEALEDTFRDFPDLNIIGCCLYAGEKLIAFSMNSRVNSIMFTEHYEKTDPAYKGAAQMINRENAKMLAPHAVWLNREQDLGVEGLRHAKMSYAPHHLIRNFALIPTMEKE